MGHKGVSKRKPKKNKWFPTSIPAVSSNIHPGRKFVCAVIGEGQGDSTQQGRSQIRPLDRIKKTEKEK